MKRRLLEYVLLPVAVAAFLLGCWFGGGQQYAESIETQMIESTQGESP